MKPAPIPHNEAERLASLQDMLLLSTPDEELFDRVTRTTKRVFDAPIVLVSLIDAQRQWFKSCVGLGARETPRDISFCGHAVAADQMLVIPDTMADPRFADNPLVTGAPHIRFYAGRPVKNLAGYAVGTLCVIDQKPRAFDQTERKLLDDLASWVESGFRERELSETQRSILTELQVARHESLTDPMLSIWNRRAAMELLTRECGHATLHEQPLSLLVVDVDHFKRVNDTYGHPVGDAVLVEIARTLRVNSRPIDTVGRYGGEEFLVVLPDKTTVQAATIAERLRSAVEASEIATPEAAIRCTISLGLASCKPGLDLCTPTDLIMRADAALLAAKRLGRNRVICDGQTV
ncbi:sensor domain-containing diguanylate cyclase [Ralstonia sp. SET104]|uniref:sensor domain-containing diguanylate cyclase n=1 Tax=Ralstonia sp. SET104 TaxID=2448774 RepID=UPI000F5888A1|nr:sensor domain-containing diguanylate cyclase [Ralstonia sp. SET104]GCB02859.1 GGDEF domain-containing protein [Ralstonia sp. SET104]